MATEVFDWICNALDESTHLTRIEARATLLVAMRAAGLDPRTLRSDQATVLVRRVLPGELQDSGVEDPGAFCDRLAEYLSCTPFTKQVESPEDIFARLG